jgi:hypothetical protein
VSGYRIRPLDAATDTAGFRCGQPALDDYLRRYASQDVRRNVAGAVVAVAGIVVDAKDAAAAAFYRHFGFVALPGRPDRLVLPTRAFPPPLGRQP